MRGALAAVLLASFAGCDAPPASAQAHPLLTEAPERCGRDPCEGAFYRSDQLEFGRHLIGAPTRVCGRDCEFEEAGVRYIAVRNRIDAMRIDVGATRTFLPFGLRGDETPEEALAAMQRVTSIPLEVSARADGGHEIAVQGSLKNALDRPQRFRLVFTPEGAFNLIEMYAVR